MKPDHETCLMGYYNAPMSFLSSVKENLKYSNSSEGRKFDSF